MNKKLTKTSREIALGKISRRSYTSWELRRALEKEQVVEADSLVADFVQQGYINDAEWLASFIRTEEAKGQGPQAIKSKLYTKGIPREEIETVMASANPKEAILLAIRKKTHGRSLTAATKQKLIAHLSRRGFSWDLISAQLHVDPFQEE